MYRVHGNTYGPSEFNPGPDGSGRFHFFGDPTVPVLYSAATETAAVAETILRRIPIKGGVLHYRRYHDRVMAGLTSTRKLRLASFLGTGLRTLKVEAYELTDTPGETNYPQTRKWAQAAHDAGFDGIAWMSRRVNSDRAYMFFGDRVTETDFELTPDTARIFAAGPDQDWLTRLCLPMHIKVRQDPRLIGH